MKASEIFEGENSSLKKAYDEAVRPANQETPEPTQEEAQAFLANPTKEFIHEVVQASNQDQRALVERANNTPDL